MASLISQEHHNFDKVFSVLNIVGRRILRWVLQHECKDKDPTESLGQYLITKRNWARGDRKKLHEPNLLDTCQDLSHSTFDITLYSEILRKCCSQDHHQNLSAGSSIYHNFVKRIKDYRNDVVHGEPAISDSRQISLLKDFRTLFRDTVNAVAVRYKVLPVDEHVFWSDVEKEFDSLEQVVRGNDEILLMLEKNAKDRITSGSNELKNNYVNWSKVTPVYFLPGWQNFDAEVNAVFTELKISDAGRKKGAWEKMVGQTVKLEDIISTQNENIVLIEGQAGAGKSTLVKYFLSSWVRGNSSDLQFIQDYELLVYLECRNSSIDSLKDLINYLLSETVRQYSMLDLLEIIKGIKVLFLIDGLDELNHKSGNLVKEIFYFAQKENFLTICTSRPTELEDFYLMKPSSSKVRHLRLDGIPSDCYEVFVERLHRHLVAENEIKNSAMLVKYIREAPETIKSHFKLPLTLTLITILWTTSPEKVNEATSVTTLFLELLNVVNKKLVERLKNNAECGHHSSEMLKKASICAYHKIGEIALKDLFRNNYVLSENDFYLIESFCECLDVKKQTIELPSSEILGAYLAPRHTWTSITCSVQYSYPLRSFQEHMAAVYVCDGLLNSHLTIEKFFEDLKRQEEGTDAEPQYETSFFDLFPHILGVLASHGESALHNYGVKFVEHLTKVLKITKDSTVRNNCILNCLAEAQNDYKIAEASVKGMDSELWMIKKNHVKPAAVMLKFLKNPPTLLKVEMRNLRGDDIEDLEDFVGRLVTIKCAVDFHIWGPPYEDTDRVARKLFSGRCKVIGFYSNVSPSVIIIMPKTLESVSLHITSDEVLTASLIAIPKLPNLGYIGLHIIVPGLDLFQMRPSAEGPGKASIIFLNIRDEDIEWLVNAAISLRPSSGYFEIYVCAKEVQSGDGPGRKNGITLKGYKHLIELISLAKEGNFTLSTTTKVSKLIYGKLIVTLSGIPPEQQIEAANIPAPKCSPFELKFS